MFVIELPTAILFIFSAVVGSKALGHRFGVAGYGAGILIGPGFLYLVFRLLGFLEAFFWGGIPRFPSCENKVCSSDDYQILSSSGVLIWKCKCGFTYQKSGRKFVKLSEAGTSVPFLVWVPFKGWVSDSETQ